MDAEAFSSLIQAAESQLDSNPEAALQQLESALELYKGDYLPDARYESWAAVEREHLAVQFLQSADHLCGLFLRFGRLEECVSLAHRILAEDPCWERAYRHLMHAFARLGDHGQVARTYRRCVQTLEAELLVTPAEETTALYHTLTGNQGP